MQTTFTINPGVGLPGQMFDDGPKEVRAFPAKVNIPFGVLCEFIVVSGVRMIQPVQDTGTAGTFLPNLAGISMYDPMHEQRYPVGGVAAGSVGWQAGEMVPVVRRGRVWAMFDGTGTWPEYAAVNLMHSSNGSTLVNGIPAQGVFTMHATQVTVGNEIDVAPSCLGIEAALAQAAFVDFSGDTVGTAVVSINLVP